MGIIQGSATNGPAIVTQPADATLAPGSAATFTVVATSSETFSYKRQKNGIYIPGAQSSSFTTAAVTSHLLIATPTTVAAQQVALQLVELF